MSIRSHLGPDRPDPALGISIRRRFDPWRLAILLVAGDKAAKWSRWYAEAIPRAERLYEIYLKERTEEEAGR